MSHTHIEKLVQKVNQLQADLADAKKDNQELRDALAVKFDKACHNVMEVIYPEQAKRIAELEAENDKLKGITHGDSSIAIIEQLEADLAAAKKRVVQLERAGIAISESSTNVMAALTDKNKEQSQRIAELEGALRQYGKHLRECDWQKKPCNTVMGLVKRECNCGLEQALDKKGG